MQNIRLITLLLIAIIPSTLLAEQTVIANGSVQRDILSRQQLRAIFSLSKQHWNNNQSIKVCVLPANDQTHKLFSRKILAIFPYQLKRNWDRLAFSGMGIPPTVVTNDQEMIEYIGSKPGAIGYISDRSLVNDAEGVKIVKVK